MILFCIPFFLQSQTVIKMKKEGGVSIIPCKVNGLKLNFIFDTGAGDVSISMTEASFMLKNDYLSTNDIKGSQKYLDANGNINVGMKIILKEVEIAGLKLFNVEASIVKNLKAPLLLGQSAISKLGKIQLDLQSNTLTILDGKSSYNFSNEEDISIKPKYTIGQNIDGGIIFYIDGTGDHGLIVLDKNIWATTDRAVGSWNEAIKACNHLGDDWRLPSKDELNLLRLKKNILKRKMRYNSSGNPIGDEDDGVYWSSTQCYNSSAWNVDFSNGEITCLEITYWMGIKAVKSF
jgi:clan AA aspartic protease (TIGR02281 family)